MKRLVSILLLLVCVLFVSPCFADDLDPAVRLSLPKNHPALAAKNTVPTLASGVFIVSWEGDKVGPYQIPMRAFRAALAPEATESKTNLDDDGEKHELQIIVGEGGKVQVAYYDHGQKIATGGYKDGKPDGSFYYYYTNEEGYPAIASRYHFGSLDYCAFESYYFNSKKSRTFGYKASQQGILDGDVASFIWVASPFNNCSWFETNGDRLKNIHINDEWWSEEYFIEGASVKRVVHDFESE